MKAKAALPGVFSRHAAAYRERLAAAVARREAKGRQLVIDLLEVRPGQRILDLGCGPGTLTFALAEAAGPEGAAVGVDLAAGMIEVARARAPANARFALMDIESLALAGGAFHAAACGHALQFCPDLHRALGEVVRVLRDGGRFAASVPAGGAGRHAWSLLEELFDELLPPRPEVVDLNGTRATTADAGGLSQAALAAGFARSEVRRVDELVSYRDPADLIDKSMSWWDCAWRLEELSAGERERVRALALARLRQKLGDGPLKLPGASHVLFAVRSSKR